MSDLVHNERTKLTATWLNGVSLAIFAAGGFGPWLTLANTGGPHYDAAILATISVVCILVSIGLHFTARVFLGRMKP